MDEETSLRQRLALDDRAVKVLEKKIHSFLGGLFKEPVASAQNSLENILIQLLSYQSNLERIPVVQKINDRDILGYNDIIKQTDGLHESTANDIAKLKEELVLAQQVITHKREYDTVAKHIMELETRDTYQESIRELEKEIAILEQEKQNKLTALETRKRDLKAAVENLKDLQLSVKKERATMTDDKRKVLEMERGYIPANEEDGNMEEEGKIEQDEKVEQEKKHSLHRFQKRSSDDEDEEGMVLDTPVP